MNIRGLVFRENCNQQLVNEISCQTIDYLDELGQQRRILSYFPEKKTSPSKFDKSDLHRNRFGKPFDGKRNKMAPL